jgi:hypothetical protein
MQQISVTQLSIEELIEEVTKPLLTRIEILETRILKKNTEALWTREEASERLKIDLSTLSRWTKQGKIATHSIGARIYYKESSIQNALILLESSKRVVL